MLRPAPNGTTSQLRTGFIYFCNSFLKLSLSFVPCPQIIYANDAEVFEGVDTTTASAPTEIRCRDQSAHPSFFVETTI